MRLSLPQRTLALTLLVALPQATASAAAPAPPPPVEAAQPPTVAPPERSSTGEEAARAATRFQEGLALRREGKLGPACDAYREVVDLTPQFALAHYELAQCLRLLGDLDGRALAHLDLAAQEVQRPPIFIERARIAEDRGDRAAAIEAYQAAAKLAPAEVRAVVGLARLGEKSDGKATLQRAQQYVDRYPMSIAGWRKLAEVAEDWKKYPVAEEALRKVLELSPHKRAAAAALGAFGQRTKKKKLVEDALRLVRPRSTPQP